MLCLKVCMYAYLLELVNSPIPARPSISADTFCMRSSFVRTAINLYTQNAAYPFNPRGNDLRAAIPMQIFTRLNAVRLLILRRHFSSLREERRRRAAPVCRSTKPVRRRVPLSASAPAQTSKDRCPSAPYICDVGA